MLAYLLRINIRYVLLIFICIWLAVEWRIDHARAERQRLVLDTCVHKGSFVIQTKDAIYGIVCGREREWNKGEVDEYEVFPLWRLYK